MPFHAYTRHVFLIWGYFILAKTSTAITFIEPEKKAIEIHRKQTVDWLTDRLISILIRFVINKITREIPQIEIKLFGIIHSHSGLFLSIIKIN